MDKTATHLCKEIQNCVCAFVQSDEISLIIKDNTLTSSPFDGRLCKLQSIIPSIATSFFNKELIKRNLISGMSIDDITNMPDYCFDCKAWTVPSVNDAMAWVLYRQIDCIRNSKQQFAQTYISHKKLLNKDTDEQVALCFEQTGNDWNAIENNKKYGVVTKYTGNISKKISKEIYDLMDMVAKPLQVQIRIVDDITQNGYYNKETGVKKIVPTSYLLASVDYMELTEDELEKAKFNMVIDKDVEFKTKMVRS